MKTLIIYYSFEGNVKLLSETMANEIKADVLELHPKQELQSTGFMKYLWGGRQVIMKEEPELEPINTNLDDYELLVIGTPVWAGSYTPAIRSFLSNNSIINKKVALFCSHEGGLGKTLNNLKNKLSSNQIISTIDFMAPLKKNREATLEKAKTWIKSL